MISDEGSRESSRGLIVASHFYWLVIGTLVVWRLTHLFYGEDGPWNLLTRLRRLAGRGVWGDLMDCFYCLSLWIAIPFGFLLGENWKERLLLWPALSGAAILLQRLSSKNESNPTVMVSEDEGES
ncbi:MAG: hypothetical protein WA869_09410 [Alloacidobacterium sp.]|jgi:hypothetical protein